MKFIALAGEFGVFVYYVVFETCKAGMYGCVEVED